jgi:hypothetical protein
MQEIMKMCWDREPEKRPTMNSAIDLIQAPEFERLRTEIILREVKSISCMCLSRILPEHENEMQKTRTEESGSVEYLSNDLTPLPPILKGPEISGENEDAPTFIWKENICGKGQLDSTTDGKCVGEFEFCSERDESFDPYTQIWMCWQYGTTKRASHVFTYNDKIPGNSVSAPCKHLLHFDISSTD